MIPALRFGLVGGGPGSFIGAVHKRAAELDGRMRLVAGCFSTDPQRSAAAGASYGIDSERCYSDYLEMFAAEAARADGIEVVGIATPNHLHLPIAEAALAAGVHVISDKPATATLAEAIRLRGAVEASDRCYALTYTYTGYEMIRRARRMIAAGDFGRVRKVVVEYPQGWLAEPVERGGNKQAEWRVDPVRSGAGGCIGDIGVHAFHLAEYVSGERVAQFVADLPTTVPDRLLDDDCNMLLRFASGAPGVLLASQISTGERNNLTLRVYCEQAGLEWQHERPDILAVNLPGGETRTLRAGAADSSDARLPVGHPEGFIEAFGNIYRDFADAVRGDGDLIGTVVPGIAAGVRGMRFVEQAVSASKARAGWTFLEDDA